MLALTITGLEDRDKSSFGSAPEHQQEAHCQWEEGKTQPVVLSFSPVLVRRKVDDNFSSY